MSFKRLKHALIGVAVAATVSVSAMLSGCTIETSHPRARITVEFNNTEYVMEYTLYRNMYPQTVRHFIELAEAGFYDNTIIHDYTTNDLYGGGFAYNSDAYSEAISDGSMDDYLDNPSYYLEDDYNQLFEAGKLTPSVYKDNGYTYDKNGNMIWNDGEALSTLYGEFKNNGHIVENGQRGSEYGALKMFYNTKIVEDSASAQVLVKTAGGQMLMCEYQYNSATSLFALQVGNSSSLSTSSYVTFAYLSDDEDEAALDDLTDAIADYIDDEYNSDSDYTVSVSTTVDRYEEIGEQATEEEYSVPKLPIIIKSVKITKY